MKAIKILEGILEFNTALRDLIILGTDKAQARFNAMNKKVNEVEEALAELQALERYIAKQAEALQAKISTRTDSGGDKEKKEAYIDILQRIRGENDNR